MLAQLGNAYITQGVFTIKFCWKNYSSSSNFMGYQEGKKVKWIETGKKIYLEGIHAYYTYWYRLTRNIYIENIYRKYILNIYMYKTGVINDPLGQPTVPAGSECRWILKFCAGRTYIRTYGQTDGRTTCVKIVITTGRDCGRPRGSTISS